LKRYYPYEEFKNDTNKLLDALKDSGIEVVVAIARGGFMLGHALSEGLDVRDLQSIRTELYDGESKRESLSLFGECDFKDKTRVMIVDDIADSGETLACVHQHLQKKHPHIVFQTATLFYKQSSCFQPDFWVQEADGWIEFFWEKDYS